MSDWQERLAEALDARGISGGELARRTGFSAQYINSMRSKERGARLPLDTARRLSHALGVTVEWLTAGTGPRERLSDVYPVYVEGGVPPESAPLTDRYRTRVEAIALLSTTVEPEVISALRAVVPDDPAVDPGREWWIEYAKSLAADLRRIKADPILTGSGEKAAGASKPALRPPAPEAARKAPGPTEIAAAKPRSAPQKKLK